MVSEINFTENGNEGLNQSSNLNNLSRYPELLQVVKESIRDYQSSFKEDEDYAMVEVFYKMDEFLPSFIDWMLTKEGSIDDVNLIDVNQFSSYQLIPPVEDELNVGNLDDESSISEVDDRTEITPPTEILFEEKDFKPSPIFPTPMPDRFPINISFGNPITNNDSSFFINERLGFNQSIENTFEFRTDLIQL